MSDFFKDIYENQAQAYETMVSYEDFQGNILPALEKIRPLSDLQVVELGAGTGRLTALIAPFARYIRAYDISAHMLSVTAEKMSRSGLSNWETQVADNRSLPAEDNSADLAIAGWSLGHSVGWYPDRWRQEIGLALAEMRRALRPRGTIIILETLGTGRTDPLPPTEGLAEFYQWLETRHGFSRTWIRTDYRFESARQAAELTRFFFGDELADRILDNDWRIVPECTGIWHLG